MGDDALRAAVAATAHDLSNAVGAVLNYATFLAEDLAGTEAGREYLPNLQSAAQRALDLVAGLAAALAADTEGD
jgi:signal transduction histidine kinase